MGENKQLRDVFEAIADPTRRRLIHLLAEAEEIPLHELTAQFPMGRTGVSKHLSILKEAGLVLDRKVGRETRFRLNATPLGEVQDWVIFHSTVWSTKMFRLNQLLEEEENMGFTLSMDFQFTTSIEKAWSALTDSGKLAKWITENDFKPVPGYGFTFRHQPSEWWDGIVEGEVLAADEPNALSYVWASGGEKQTVTWTLQNVEDGEVNLHLEQAGFTTTQGLEGARYGWNNWFGEFEKVLE